MRSDIKPSQRSVEGKGVVGLDLSWIHHKIACDFSAARQFWSPRWGPEVGVISSLTLVARRVEELREKV